MPKILGIISAGILAVAAYFLLPNFVQARENVNYWYIKNFDSEIILNKDSSVLITEKIEADCGNAIGKHGIFRILSTKNAPIKLVSITDFNNKPLKYEAIKNRIDQTITWKIGDPNVEVTGVNYYKIKYKIENAVSSKDSFDEFYWNLNGNFWDIETDNFTAKIYFPIEVTKDNTNVDYFTGLFGSKSKDLASYSWLDANTLEFKSTTTLGVSEGITVLVNLPKNFFTIYTPGFFAKYGQYFYLLIPLLVFGLCLFLWSKYGNDPDVAKTIVPEFEIPAKLSPMEMGMVISDGGFKSQYISAEIVNLATKGILKIEEIQEGKIFKHKDYKLILQKEPKEITEFDKLLLEKLFGGKKEVKISSLKNEFYKDIPDISKKISSDLISKNLIIKRSRYFQIGFLIAAGVLFWFTFSAFAISVFLVIALAISTAIVLIFSFLMPIRTKEGAETLRKIWGFKLYMQTAEKYRQRFNEKENIFERFLPYAMLFGITELWISKMKVIYGQDYYNTYAPAWYAGAFAGGFNADSFNSAMHSISSNMSSTLASAPGGSGGGAGGGGGGGGGGGW